MAGRSDIEAGRAFVRLYVKNAELTKGLESVKGTLDKFGSKISDLGRQFAALGVAASLPFVAASTVFVGFDDKMREVKAVTEATDKEFSRLSDTAKKLSGSFTAADVGGLMAELGRAGFTAKQVDTMTASVLNLARATTTDATLASGIMAATLRQFGMSADQSARVADTFTVAANKSFNSVESLGEALSYAGPVANDFKMSLEDTLAVLGGLGNVGIQGSNAGTALRRLLTISGAEAKKLKDIFGVSFVDAAGNVRPLVDTLGEVNKATKGLGTAARASKFNEAFGLLGITSASAIGTAAVDIGDLKDAIDSAAGASEKAASQMDAGLGGSVRRVRASVEGATIAVGEALAPALSQIAGIIQKTAVAFRDFTDENQSIVTNAAIAAAAIGGIGVSLLAVGGAIKVAGAAFGVAAIAAIPFSFVTRNINAGLFAVANGMRQAATAVSRGASNSTARLSALGASFATGLSNGLNSMVVSVRSAVTVAASTLGRLPFVASSVAAGVGVALSSIRTQGIVAASANAARAVAASWSTVGPQIARGIATSVSGAFGMVNRIVSTGGMMVSRGLNRAVNGAMGIAGVIGSTIGGTVGTLASMSSQMLLMGGLFGSLINPATLLMGVLAGGAVAWFKFSDSGKASLAKITSALSPFAATAKQAFGGIKDAIATGDFAAAGKIAVTALKVAFLQGLESLQGSVDGVTADMFGTLAEQIQHGEIGEAWKTLVTYMDALWQALGKGIVDSITSTLNTVMDKWSETVRTIADKLIRLGGASKATGELMSIVFQRGDANIHPPGKQGINVFDENLKSDTLELARRERVKKTLKDSISEQATIRDAAMSSGDKSGAARAQQMIDTLTKELDKVVFAVSVDGVEQAVDSLDTTLSDTTLAVKDYISAVQQTSSRMAADAEKTLADRVTGAAAMATMAREEAQKELAEQTRVSASKIGAGLLGAAVAGALTEPVGVAGGQAAAGGNGGAGIAASAKESLVTFSAAALGFAGGAGASEVPRQTLEEIRNSRRAQQEAIKEAREMSKTMKQLERLNERLDRKMAFYKFS